MAKWPKDSPGTWYSHYKRGSLVSGPACSPGWGLDFVCLMLCMVLVLPCKVCICIDAFLIVKLLWCLIQHEGHSPFSPATFWRCSQQEMEERFRDYTGKICKKLCNWVSKPVLFFKFLTVFPPCHTSATFTEHLLRVTVCLDTPLYKLATAGPYVVDVWSEYIILHYI